MFISPPPNPTSSLTQGAHGRDNYAKFVVGADFFKNIDRFLKTGQMKTYVKKAEHEDRADLQNEKKKAKTVLMKRGIEPDDDDGIDDE